MHIFLKTTAWVPTKGAPPLSNAGLASAAGGVAVARRPKTRRAPDFRAGAGDQKKRVALLDTGGSAQPLPQTPAQFSDLLGSL